MKKFSILLIAIALLFAMILSACDETTTTTAPAVTTAAPTTGAPSTEVDPDAKVYVKMFKCGKADSFLIRTETKTVLIDTGEDDDYDKILEYLASKNITKIDYMIVTQFNKNHSGSVGAILDAVEVETILDPTYKKSSTSYTVYTQALAAANKTATKVEAKMTLELDGAILTIYPSDVAYSGIDFDEYNSLVVTLSFGGNNMLFAGDIFGERINEITKKLEGQTFDIIKVPNHGTYDTKSESFLTTFAAKYAVITASDKNPADSRILTYLANAGSNIYVTKDGAVEIRLGNGYYQIKQSELEWNTVQK